MLSRRGRWSIGVVAGIVALAIAAGQAYGIYQVVDFFTGSELGPRHARHFIGAVQVAGFDRLEWRGERGEVSVAWYVGSVETDDDGVAVPDRLADLVTGPSLRLQTSRWPAGGGEVPLFDGTGIDRAIIAIDRGGISVEKAVTCYVSVTQYLPDGWPPLDIAGDDLLTPSELKQFQAGELVIISVGAGCEGEL